MKSPAPFFIKPSAICSNGVEADRSVDLADGLMLSSETIEALQGKLGSAFSFMLSHRGKPVLEQMAESLKSSKTRTNKTAPTSSMASKARSKK